MNTASAAPSNVSRPLFQPRPSCRLLAAAVTVFASCAPLIAEEGGAGHYMPGGMATLFDAPPTKPGWSGIAAGVNYQGNASVSRTFPQAGLVTAGLDVTSNAGSVGAFYTLEQTVLDAHYTVGAFLPFVSTEVKGSITSALGNVQRTDSVTGVGDISFIPAMLAWKSGAWQFDALLNVYAPTGEYKTGRLANLGMNHWTFDPAIGLSYTAGKTGTNFSLYSGITLNTENNATHYRSGSVLHTDASITQLIPLGKGSLGIGANAFLYEQVTGDSGSGAKLGSFEGRSVGVGPVLSYFRVMGSQALAVELKWLPEHNTEKRLESNIIYLKIGYHF